METPLSSLDYVIFECCNFSAEQSYDGMSVQKRSIEIHTR